MKWLGEQAKVEIVLPVAIGLGLLAYVFSLAVGSRSAGQFWVVVQHTWLLILLLTFPYLAARALVWHELLIQVGIKIHWRQLIAAFSAGELTKGLPAGIYTQNYLLGRLDHFGRVSLVRSGMATTAMLGLETLIALPVALIVGIPGAPWLFWTLLGIVLLWLAVLGLAWMLVNYWAARVDAGSHPWLQRGLALAQEFLDAAVDLVAVRTVKSLIPTAAYMLIYVVDLYAIIRAVGVSPVTFAQTMAVYAVVVLAVVLVPIPTELGITEFTGFGALAAYGVSSSTAAVIMLCLRLQATGMTMLVAGLLLFLTRGELAAAQRRETSPGEPAGGEASAGG